MNAMNPPWERPAFGRGFRGRPPFGPMTARMDAPAPPPPPFEGGDERAERRERRGRRHGGPGFGPAGPGFGPGFGAGGPRGRGRGPRGRRTARGDIRAAVLALVAEQPRHGYEIIQEIAERSGGAWRPSPGSVYPTLSQLEDEGLVTVEKTDGRRVVSLTEAGTTYVAEHREELDKVWRADADTDDDGARALWEQLGQLNAAAQQVTAAGTPEQIAAASAALAEARKTIYRLLAE